MKLSRLAISILLCSFVSASANAAFFHLFYDAIDDGFIDPFSGDIVGEGFISYDGPVEEGIFLFSDLSGLDMSVTFFSDFGDSATFIGPPFDPSELSDTGISILETEGGEFELTFIGEFTDTGGSLDIFSEDGILSHEPNPFDLILSGPLLYFAEDFGAEIDYFGDYIGTTSPVPLPPAIWSFGAALIGLFGIRRLDRGKSV